jgi:excinuclease ABC subunit C
MKNSNGGVIYVGKAKKLKNRVLQYFQSGGGHTPKVAAMVSNVADFEYIITDTEFEALVLECSLIKKYRPKYNVLLKDDKSYPFIKVTREEYPRILLARKIEDDGARYFGPYLNSAVIKEAIDLIKKVFMVRSCKRVLPRDIGKGRPCLNYHINQCSAPCTGKVTSEEYASLFDDVVSLLEGKHEQIIESLTAKMHEASEKLEYEQAAKFRDKINAINKMSQKQKIVSTTPGNYDVIAMAHENKTVCIQVFFMRSGKMVGRENYIFKNDETDKAQIMAEFVKEYYGMATFVPKTIILEVQIEDSSLIERWLSEKAGASISIVMPQRGEKRSVVNMVKQNALEELKAYLMKTDKTKRKINDILFEIKDTLSLPKVPVRIEAYDISNLSGSDSVGVCVVFENASPSKKDYKKFNIRSVEGPNDYESIKEVLYRRLSNAAEGEEGFTPLPDLILIDGGKAHVGAASEIISFFRLDIPCFGMVKDEKHKTKGLTAKDRELYIKRQSKLFRFITCVQDEVHRFAVASHRKRHKKTAIASQLEAIKGVGKAKRTLLLNHFKSIKAIKEASLEELGSVKGVDKKTAQNIFEYFNK